MIDIVFLLKGEASSGDDGVGGAEMAVFGLDWVEEVVDVEERWRGEFVLVVVVAVDILIRQTGQISGLFVGWCCICRVLVLVGAGIVQSLE